MVSQIHGHVLFDAAEFRNLFQIDIQPLVAGDGQQFIRSGKPDFVLLQYHLWDRQQGNVDERVGLLPYHENPLLPVLVVEILFTEGFQVLVMQACKARKDEKVTHLFQTRCVKRGFHQSAQFLFVQTHRRLSGSKLSFYRSHICPPFYNAFMDTCSLSERASISLPLFWLITFA